MVVMIMVGVVSRANIFHLQDVAAFGAALNGAVAGHLGRC